MSQVAIFAEHDGEDIHPVTFELLKKGRELADKLGVNLAAILLSGDDVPPEELVYRGADAVYYGKHESLAAPDEIAYKKALVNVIEEFGPEILLIGATHFGRSLAPRVAMAKDASLTADCTGLDVDESGNFIQIRPAFSGNVLARIQSKTPLQLATVRYKQFAEAVRVTDRDGEIVELEINDQDVFGSGMEITEVSGDESVDLEDAEVIVAGGRGLEDPKDLKLLQGLVDVIGGKLGASRPLVDEGWIDRGHQVGYSGRRVKPEIYFACGISGQSQHLAGMKDSSTVIAINSDPSAPIFDFADYGIVGDLYEVIPELTKSLKEEKSE